MVWRYDVQREMEICCRSCAEKHERSSEYARNGDDISKTGKQRKKEKKNIRNGPPLVGKFSNDTLNATPIPLGLAMADTLPLMFPRGSLGLKNEVEGRVAV